MRKILLNKITCLKCGESITSSFRHDFKYCACGNIANDGGNDYFHRIGSKENYDDLSVISDGTFELERQYIKWGVNYDKDGNLLPKKTVFKVIKDLETDHIYAILELPKLGQEYRKLFEEEIIFRENE